jgi:hypothetical protein
MTRPHKLGAVVTAIVLAIATNAASADPTSPTPPVITAVPPLLTFPAFAHLGDPSTLTTHAGNVFTLPPGYWMDESTHLKVDTEMKRLQDAETNLTAQNQSLRKSASGFTPGWKTLATAIITGIVIGVYADRKL